MTALTPMQSRYLALGILVVVVSLAAAALCYPWVATYTAQAAELDHKERQIRVYRDLAANQNALQEELQQVQRRNPAAAYFVTGETPALASASMQQYVRQIIDQQGGELISTQVVEKGDDTQGSTGLNVHLRADMSTSTRILYMLESGKPLLFIDNLTISARLVRGTSVGDAPRVSLDMNFDVTGYVGEGA